MRYTLLVALLSGAICCAQESQVSKQSLHGTISNLDTEPAPYNPDAALPYAASPAPTLRAVRRDSAPGPTLGDIADFQETYGLPIFGQGNLAANGFVYPGYFGYAGNRPEGRITSIHIAAGVGAAVHATSRRGR